MKNIRRNQQGSIGIAVISIVTMLIVGTLGYLYWDNFMKPKDTNAVQQVAVKNEDKPKEETKDPNEGYLVLEDWKIRFKLPKGLDAVQYYKEKIEHTAYTRSIGMDGDYYEFSTQRVENLGNQCVEPVENGPFVIRLGSLTRSAEKRNLDGGSPPSPITNNPIDGYYYYASAGQSTCALEGGAIQKEDRDLIHQMLITAEAM